MIETDADVQPDRRTSPVADGLNRGFRVSAATSTQNLRTIAADWIMSMLAIIRGRLLRSWSGHRERHRE